jgi:hypothetical protein
MPGSLSRVRLYGVRRSVFTEVSMTACRASRSVATLAFSMAALGICAPSGSAQQPDSPSVQQSVPAAGQPEPVPAQQPPPAAQQQVQAPPPTPPPAPGKAGRGTPWAKFAAYKDFFPLLAGSATVLAILLTGRWAWAAALRATELQRQLAQGSVLLSCNERYDRILKPSPSCRSGSRPPSSQRRRRP